MLSAAMPPEPPAPNLNSPRVQAALKVLGVSPHDLAPIDRGSFEDGMRGDVRWEVLEKKRRHLCKDVAAFSGERAIGPAALKAAVTEINGQTTNEHLAQVLAREKKTLEKLRVRAKMDVQKIVYKELDAKKANEERAMKTEESEQRLKELKKGQDEQLKALQREAQRRADKNRDVRERADRRLAEEAEEMVAKLNAAETKAEAVMQERAEALEERRRYHEQKDAMVRQRQERRKREDMRAREQQYGEILMRHADRMSALADLVENRQDRTEELRAKTERNTAKAIQAKREQQDQREEAYRERRAVHMHAQEIRDINAAERHKQFALANAKAKNSHAVRWDRLKRETEASNVPDPRLTRSMSDTNIGRREASQRLWETAKTMEEVNKANLKQLSRAQKYCFEQGLVRIDQVRSRVESMEDSKRRTEQRRYDMMKNCAIEKMHLTDQVNKARDCTQQQMDKLCMELGIAPLPTKGKEGEEEGEAKS